MYHEMEADATVCAHVDVNEPTVFTSLFSLQVYFQKILAEGNSIHFTHKLPFFHGLRIAFNFLISNLWHEA